MKVRVVGREQLDPNQTYVFVANHRSYLDAAPLFAFTGRRMGMIAKKELLNAPILGYGMGFVNVIAIDRSNRERAVESLKVATERLRSGISFGVCPEGTRAQPGEMLPFKKGAFHMAAQAGVPIAPIALKNCGQIDGQRNRRSLARHHRNGLSAAGRNVVGQERQTDLVNQTDLRCGQKYRSEISVMKPTVREGNVESKLAMSVPPLLTSRASDTDLTPQQNCKSEFP